METHAMANQKASRGEAVNSSAADSPDAIGEYWIWYREIRRRNIAETVPKVPHSMLTETMNLQDFNMSAGNLVAGGISAAQLSKI